MIKSKSASITGSRENQLSYSVLSIEHEKLENVLKQEIIKLIDRGVTQFYTGGQTGIDELAGLIIIYLRDELNYSIKLNLVLPYMGMEKHYNSIQKVHFQWILKRADSIIVLNDRYTKKCYKELNQYMTNLCDFLIAVLMKDNKHSDTQMTITLGKKKGIEIRIVDPITYKIEVILGKILVNIIN